MLLKYLKNSLRHFYQFWTNLSYIKYIIFSVFFGLILTLPVAILCIITGVESSEIGGPSVSKIGLGRTIVMAIIVAPISETFMGQWLPIRLIQQYIPWHPNKIAIIFSSVFFALGHLSYSFWYFLLTLPMGFILAVTFVTYQKRVQSSFWTSTLIHAGKNALAVLSSFRDFLSNNLLHPCPK